MNEQIKYRVEELKKAISRLEAALNTKEVAGQAVGPVVQHLNEMSVFVNNFATGLAQQGNTVEWLADNPPPLRSPDIEEYEDDE
jgi:hypothetical protein